MDIQKFFTEIEKEAIKKAIYEAEMQTSGEIRVHIENVCKEDVLDHTAFLFKQLGMHKTELRNGILFYLSIEDHQFAVIGDAGIHAKVGDDFWENIKNEMIDDFKKGEFCKGLCEGINKAGEQLKTFFPRSKNDINELNDDISFKKN